jgi:hypothetical protein
LILRRLQEWVIFSLFQNECKSNRFWCFVHNCFFESVMVIVHQDNVLQFFMW